MGGQWGYVAKRKSFLGFSGDRGAPGAARTQILVIEDDPHMQKVLHRIFREQGYSVSVCGDGQTGLDAFHSVRPSAVVLDLMLPNIFGRDLCKIMKAEQPGIPGHRSQRHQRSGRQGSAAGAGRRRLRHQALQPA
jgi:CheY-like chemotaxis protein